MLLGAHPVAVADVLAAVLRAVAEKAGPGGPVVLTVPSTWGATRRAVLVEAAERAGLGPVTLIGEPIAAANYLQPGGALLVVDVGAGTADIALVQGQDVVAQRGLDVGGLDIDAALVQLIGRLVEGEAWRRLAAPATNAERRDRLVFWQEVRAAKESLSRLSVAPVHVPGCPADLHLTREELEAAATPLLAPIADVAAEVVGDRELAGVFLVGGGSRMPLLGRLLHARLGMAPTVVERPESVVAEGAVPAHKPAAAAAAPAERRRRRWLNPATLVLTLLCLLLPFATVSCGLPDGYGHAKPGGSSAYSGLDLALGGTPDVPADQRRPAGDDRIPPQPFDLAALLLIGAALFVGRRAVVAGLGALAAVSLAAGQMVITDRLAARIREQSAIPPGKTARDFVTTGAGFWLALVLLAVLTAANLAALLRSRHRS